MIKHIKRDLLGRLCTVMVAGVFFASGLSDAASKHVALDHPSHPLHIYIQRLDSCYLLGASPMYTKFIFKGANGGTGMEGNTQLYPVRFSYQLKDHWFVGATYDKSVTRSHSYAATSLSHLVGTEKTHGDGVGLHVQKVWDQTFSAEIYGHYTHNQYEINKSVATIGTQDQTFFDSGFKGHGWLAGAKTGLVHSFHHRWILAADLNMFYLHMHQNGHVAKANGQSAVPVPGQDASFMDAAENVVAAYLLTKHVRPFVALSSLQVLTQKHSSASNEAALQGGKDALQLGRFAYSVGSGVEMIWRHFSVAGGYLYTRRGSTFHSHGGALVLTYAA